MKNVADLLMVKTDHTQVQRVSTLLRKEGFEITGLARERNAITASFIHAGKNEAAFMQCDDLSDADNGWIKRGQADLETSPPKIPLSAYRAPVVQ